MAEFSIVDLSLGLGCALWDMYIELRISPTGHDQSSKLAFSNNVCTINLTGAGVY